MSTGPVKSVSFNFVVIVLFAAACFPSQAYADPISLTGGSFVFSSGRDGNLRIQSEDFNLRATSFDDNDFGVPFGLCNPCGVGDAISLHDALPLSEFFAFEGALRGIPISTPLFLGGVLTFSSTSVQISSPPDFDITFPFTVSGTLKVFAAPEFHRGDLLFSAGVTGGGTARVSFVNSARGVQLSLEASSATTPEPATLLLLAGGATILRFRQARTLRTENKG